MIREYPLIEPPVYIFSQFSTDLDVFAVVGDAENSMEAADVEDGEYGPAFDSLARPLAIELPAEPVFAPVAASWFGRLCQSLVGGPLDIVIVRLADDSAPRPQAMAAALANVLPGSEPTDDLAHLMSLARERWGVHDNGP